MKQVLSQDRVVAACRSAVLALVIAIVLAGCGDRQLTLTAAQSGNQAVVLPTPTPMANRQVVAYAAQPALSGDIALEDRLIQLYAQANPSVVYIIAQPIGSGSGFVYDDQGHIVTNNHVVEGAVALEVVFANGERRSARVVGTDTDGDLAVIQVDTLPSGVSPLPLAAADDIAVGQFVVAIGNPFGEQGSMSLGIVSGLGRSLASQRADEDGSSSYTLPAVIQTDAPINPGNSGGPLLNLAGQVIGINAAIASTTGANTGVGFSIPVGAIQRIVPNLITEGRHTYSYLGVGFDDEISLADQARYELPQTQGAYIISVTPGGPAEQAGLRAPSQGYGRGGDLITGVNDQAIRNFQELNRYLVFNTAPGQNIQLSVLRDGRDMTIPFVLGERP
jgi:S1-C subfamily serine protease